MNVSIVRVGEVRPTNIATVIAPSAKNQKPDAFPMKWGFIHPTRGMLVFNTRSETAAQKALFATSIEGRRCLIPASCYYEWQKADGKKIKYAIKPKSTPLYLAGLYIRSSKERIPCFSILTMDAAESIKAIHARIGRLIRSETDKGIISIIDPRLSQKSNSPYRHIVLDSLPIKNCTSDLDVLRAFYRKIAP